jgi:hypothetical protein
MGANPTAGIACAGLDMIGVARNEKAHPKASST